MDAMTGLASGPVRRNAVDRERVPACDMIRYVADDEGRVVPDLAGKLPGRGVWLAASRDAVVLAVRRNVFARELRRKVVVDPELAGRVEALLLRRCLQQLSLARRAGQLVAGFDQVAAALSADAAGGRSGGVLVLARDAAADAERLRRAARGRVVLSAFSREDMGRQIGRDALVYASMEGGAIAAKLVAEAGKLRGFRDFEMIIPDRRSPGHEGGTTKEGKSRTQ